MKKLVISLALIASILVPTQAQAAQTQFTGGPLTDIDSQGATINIRLSNVPANSGLYLQQCVQAGGQTRPTICNPTSRLWISKDAGANFLPSDTIKFKPSGIFMSDSTKVDCGIEKCGIFIRFDRKLGDDLSEDQFIALTFKAPSGETVTLPNDEIVATIDGIAVNTRTPKTLTYRQVVQVSATSKVGARLTFASLTPKCALNGVTITPLSGVGECAISVTSAGNEKTAGITAILPIQLALGVQNMGNFNVKKSVKIGTRISLPSASNFGETLAYKATGSCSIKSLKLNVRKGSCTLTATAPAKVDSYKGVRIKYTLSGK